MILKKIITALATVALLGCEAISTQPQMGGSPPATAGDQQELKRVYAGLGKAGGSVFRLTPQASTVRIYVFRAGRAAKLGHNHVLSAPRFLGYVHLPPEDMARARFDLEFRLDQLEIDKPEYRSILGSAFASRLSQEAVEATREHMLSRDSMGAGQFPVVRIRSLEIVGEFPKFAAKILIGMHGRERDMWVPLNVEANGDSLSIAGSFVVKQTDYDVPPYSVLGGMLAVQDALVIEFNLRADPVGSLD